MNQLYPVYIKLSHKNCVVIGGGKIAYRKVKILVVARANVKIISLEFCEELNELVKALRLDYSQRAFEKSDLDGAFIVIAATNDPEANQRIWEEANHRNILVNVVDVPELCNFYVPSVIRDGDLAIAISTNGKAPYVAKKLRLYLQNILTKLNIHQIIHSVDKKKQSLKRSIPENIKERERQIKVFTDHLLNNL
jgi:precorrin-2 dehydrogenase / sirohydrochlorin ferrochelatase